MAIALTTFVMACTIFSGLKKLFNFLFSWRALFSLVFILAILAAWASIFACLCLELWDNVLDPTIHSCSCYTHLCTLLPPAIKHESQPTLRLCETLGVRGRQILSPGHHPKVGVSQILSKLMLQSLVGLTYEFRLSSYNFSDQRLAAC